MRAKFLYEIEDLNHRIELPPVRAVYFMGGQNSLIRDIAWSLEAITGIEHLGNCTSFGVHCERTRHRLGHMVRNKAAAATKAKYAANRKIRGKSTPHIKQTAVKAKNYTILEVFPWSNAKISGKYLQGARRIDVATPGTLTVEELTAELTRRVNGQAFLPEYEGVFEF